MRKAKAKPAAKRRKKKAVRRTTTQVVSRVTRTVRSNPPGVEIYRNIKHIVAVKGPGHQCDAKCRKAGHTYIHKFKSGSGIYGMSDGSIVVRRRRS